MEKQKVMQMKPDRVPTPPDSRMSAKAMDFAQLVTNAGEAAVPVLGAMESVRALMAATVSVALSEHGARMTRDDVVDWLHRLAAEIKAGGGKPS